MKTVSTITITSIADDSLIASYVAKNTYEAKRIKRLIESLDFDVEVNIDTQEFQADGTAQEITKLAIATIMNHQSDLENGSDENVTDES